MRLWVSGAHQQEGLVAAAAFPSAHWRRPTARARSIGPPRGATRRSSGGKDFCSCTERGAYGWSDIARLPTE